MEEILNKGELIKDGQGIKYMVFRTIPFENSNYAICMNLSQTDDYRTFEYKFEDSQLKLRLETDSQKEGKIILKALDIGK
jgi:hypothetical protein